MSHCAPRPPRRALRWVLAATALLVGFVAVLHTDAGRPLLRALSGGACPLDAATPESVDAARLEAARATAGDRATSVRPALAFSFERSTLASVLAWAEAHGLACAPSRGDSFVRCSDVPGDALAEGAAPVSDLALGFAPDGRLVNLTTLRQRLTPADAAVALDRSARALEAALGPATRAVGERTAAALEPRFATTTIRYRFTNYQAEVTGAHLPGRGVVLREHFMAVD